MELDDLFKRDFTRIQRPEFQPLLRRAAAELAQWERDGKNRPEMIKAIEDAWMLLQMWVEDPPTEDDEASLGQAVRHQITYIIGRANAYEDQP